MPRSDQVVEPLDDAEQVAALEAMDRRRAVPGLQRSRLGHAARLGEPVREDLVEDRVADPGRRIGTHGGGSILAPMSSHSRVPPLLRRAWPLSRPQRSWRRVAPRPSAHPRRRQSGRPRAARSRVPAWPEPPVCDPASNAPPTATAPWWRDRVFYEVFVRSFADSDGDGIGDLRGLTDRLDYLNDGDPATTDDLGVTGLWLMPIAESPSYHGYDVTDYEAVEPDYGTAEDFRAFMAAAHERGIAVIVDLVLNHTSIEHPWFQDARTPGSEHDDWYVWSTTGARGRRPGGRRVVAQGRRPLLLRLLLGGDAGPELRQPRGHRRARRRRPVLARGDGRGRLPARRRSPPDRGRDRAREHAGHVRPGCATSGRASRRPSPTRWSSARSGTPRRCRRAYVREGALDLTFDFGLAGAIARRHPLGDAGSLPAVTSGGRRGVPAGRLRDVPDQPRPEPDR